MVKLSFRNFQWFIGFSLVLAVLSFPVIARVWFDYLHDGNPWRQGDWLINLGSGFVRRGVMGEAFMVLSDVTGINLLVVVQIFQSLLFVALVFVTWIIGLIHKTRLLLIFLAASPAFFLIFFAGDLEGTMRKELFGLLAVALLALGSVKAGRSTLYPILAVVFYTLGTIGNVLHSFMVPTIIAGLYLTLEGKKITKSGFRILAWFSLAMSTLWMGVAILFRDISELAGMCSALVSRGLDENICSGALYWLVAGNIDHSAQLILLLTPGALVRFFAVTVLSLMPVILSFFFFRERRILILLVAVVFVPMLPLYAIATDWGRWLSISYTSFVFLVIQAHAVNRLTFKTEPSIRLIIPLMAVALLITPALDIGWQPGGAILSTVSTALAFR